MSFEPIRYLDDAPKLRPNSPEQFEQHYRETVEFVRSWFNKQRELGLGVDYDAMDRVEVPLWYLWMMT